MYLSPDFPTDIAGRGLTRRSAMSVENATGFNPDDEPFWALTLHESARSWLWERRFRRRIPH
jgi:hypothetical protein